MQVDRERANVTIHFFWTGIVKHRGENLVSVHAYSLSSSHHIYNDGIKWIRLSCHAFARRADDKRIEWRAENNPARPRVQI
jgi:hypothetical protein